MDLFGYKFSVSKIKADKFTPRGFYTTLISGVNNVNYDMHRDSDKLLAFRNCTPLNSVISKSSSLFSNGKFYVVDKENNDITGGNAEKIINLLKQPNPLQSGRVFNRQVEACLKLFGRCPIYTLRGTKTSIPVSMWIIPPILFKQVTTGKLWGQSNKSDIIKETYIEWAGDKIILDEEDYFIVIDSDIDIQQSSAEIRYSSATNALTNVVNNWMAQAIARGNLIINGGPKGVLCNDDNSELQNLALTPEEQKDLNSKFKEDYGFVNKPFQILVTMARLKWLPLSFDVAQLKLHEEDKSCVTHICSTIGLNPNIFIPNSTFSNLGDAQKTAYQDVIIPDAENYAETLTSAICPNGLTIKLDYTHIDILQKDKKEAATALAAVSNAISNLINDKIISTVEARIELSNYIDIDPENIQGEIHYENQGTENRTEAGKV